MTQDILVFILGEERANIALKYAGAIGILLIIAIGWLIWKFKIISQIYEWYWSLRTKFRDLEILKAEYGAYGKSFDVTLKLNKRVKGNKFNDKISNEIGGDPFFGFNKIIQVKYRFKKKVETVIVKENDYLNIP